MLTTTSWMSKSIDAQKLAAGKLSGLIDNKVALDHGADRNIAGDKDEIIRHVCVGGMGLHRPMGGGCRCGVFLERGWCRSAGAKLRGFSRRRDDYPSN